MAASFFPEKKGATTSVNTYVSITTPAFTGGGTLNTGMGVTTLGDGGKKFANGALGNNWGDYLRRGRVPSRPSGAGFLDVASFERRRRRRRSGRR